MKFPKVIKVVIIKDGNSQEWLNVTDLFDVNDGQKVAVYELKEIKTMKIEKSLK